MFVRWEGVEIVRGLGAELAKIRLFLEMDWELGLVMMNAFKAA